MSTRKLYLFVISLLLLNTQINGSWSSFFEYIWPKRTGRLFGGDVQSLPHVPFEVGERDEKFISESAKVIGRKLSELDFCQQKIILLLRNSCSSLDDEQVGKLAVLLMNCQLQSEGRRGYECTEGMALEQCTSSIPEDAQHLYHDFQNRAKTICLVIRQDQFRGLAEITVNNLIASAHENIDLMTDLKKSQHEMQRVSLNAIEEIADNGLKLLEQQQDLLKIAESQRINSDHNLQLVLRERNVLKAGHMEISSVIMDLKSQMQTSLANFRDQSGRANEVYNALLGDITELHETTEKIAQRLDEASRLILEQHKLAKNEFQETVTQLREVNDIVDKLSRVVKEFQDSYKEKMQWLRSQIGGSEETLIKQLGTISIHVVYLMVGMLCLIFVNAEMLSRVLFLLIVFLNMVAVSYQLIQLDISTLTQTIAVVLGTKYAYSLLQKFDWKKCFEINRKTVVGKNPLNQEFSKNNSISRGSFGDVRTTRSEISTTARTAIHFDRNNNNNNVDEDENEGAAIGRRTTLPPMPYTQISNGDEQFSDRSRSSTPFSGRSSYSVGGVNRCKALTARGTQCQLTAVKTYCRIHERPSYER